MASISLTQGFVAQVDEADYERLSQYSWTIVRAAQKKDRWYACRHYRNKTLYMHREIVGALPGVCVDHIDNDGLNNCRSNLRLATYSQNNANRWNAASSAMYRGVHSQYAGRYRAVVYVSGKNKHLGVYGSPIEAAYVRDLEAIRMFGEFAILNFPCLLRKGSKC